jgi:phage terminase small subunit
MQARQPVLRKTQIAVPQTREELVDYFQSPLGQLATGMYPGEAFAALTPKARAFVMALIQGGGGNMLRAAKMAGYEGNDHTVQVSSSRLASDPKVQRALTEIAMGLAKSSSLLAITELIKMIQAPGNDKTKLTAISKLITLIGLDPVKNVNVKHTVEVLPTTKEQVDDIVRMAKELDIDPRKLLGRAGVVVDGEFEVAGCTTGLTDLLGD